MKVDVAKIMTSFPAALCLEFIGAEKFWQGSGNSTQHPKYGLKKLTPKQFESSPGHYKQKLYRNIIECFQTEIDYLLDGTFPEALEKPLVDSGYMKMIWGKDIEWAHLLNKWVKYPELMQKTEEAYTKISKVLNQQMAEAKYIDSKMPYKSQFVLEEIIEMTQKRWSESV